MFFSVLQKLWILFQYKEIPNSIKTLAKKLKLNFLLQINF